MELKPLEQIVYKVVRPGRFGYISAIPHCYRIFYPVGITVKPPIGLLLAFDSLANADKFRHIGNRTNTKEPLLVTFKAIATGVTATEISVSWDKTCIDRLWSGIGVGVYIAEKPIGTIGCKTIKLIERVS